MSDDQNQPPIPPTPPPGPDPSGGVPGGFQQPPQYAAYPRTPIGGYAGPIVRIERIGDAWRMIQAELGTWALASLIMLLFVGGAYVPLLMLSFGAEPQDMMTAIVGTPVQWILTLAVTVVGYLGWAMMMAMALRQVRGEKIAIGDMLRILPHLGHIVVGSVIMSILITIGSYLCCLPALLLGGLFMFAIPIMIDQGVDAITAMKRSWNTLQSQVFMAAVFYFLASLVSGLGACACFIGLVVTLPIYVVSVALLYSDFFLTQPSPSSFGISGPRFP